ncbi:acyltransferase family protein [Agrococcus sp. HG114]|uniref:acyltransferase family protein n=1 Tax=Agrococcus sp. HG114 TaxID=2969757 RepID=UPI00215A94FC|nr:acyltransferase family protein [Agrococcus sp. HG114]MCR8671572.1 acyltransferase [Agrococcus sp. HG114]
MTAAAPPRRPDIQGLRAIASLLVASYHVWFGNVSGGVDVFFALGGYLLAGSLMRQVERTGRIDVLGQLRRTAKRLFPMAGLVLLVVGASTAIAAGPLLIDRVAGDVLASATFSENWRLAASATAYVDAGHAKSAFQHFWAMGVQAQFTVLCVVAVAGLALLLRRRPRWDARASVAVLLAAVAAASFAYATAQLALDPVPVYFDTFARAWELALGGVAALVLARIPFGTATRAAMGVAGLALVLTAGLLPVEWAQPGLVSLWPVSGALLILLAGEGGARGPVARALAWPPLVWLGGISYGVYLWHWPLLKGLLVIDPAQAAGVGVVQGLAVLAAAIAIAWASTRMLRALGRATRGSMRRAPIIAVPALAAAAAIGIAIAPSVQERAIVAQASAAPQPGSQAELEHWIADAVDAPAPATVGVVGEAGHSAEWLVHGCVTVEVSLEERCRFETPGSGGREVWLVGDSQAVTLALPVRKALAGIADVQLLGRALCPFSASSVVDEQLGEAAWVCDAQIERVLELAEQRRPELVVISYGAWWAGDGYEHLGDDVGRRLATGTVELVDRLAALGVGTVWLDGPPPAAHIDGCMLAHAAGAPLDSCSSRLQPEQLQRHLQMHAVFEEAGADAVDTLGWYCDVERMLCPLVVRGVPTWTDERHLGAAGAMQRVAVLMQELLPRTKG